MSVIREDVVQIGFDIENNPFQELVNSINQMKRAIIGATDDGEDGIQDMVQTTRRATSGMTDLAQEARRAGHTNLNGLRQSVTETTAGMNELVNSARTVDNADMDGLKRSTRETEREVTRMNISLTALIAKSAVLSKLRLAMAFQSLKVVPRTIFNKITGGLHKMKNGFASIKNMSFKRLLSHLNQLAGKGLLKGWQGAKKLWSALKQVASVSFQKLKGQVSVLIPKMKQLAIASAKVFGKGVMKGIKGFGAGIAGIGKMATKATKIASVGMLGVSAAAFKVGMDFDSSMSQVAATMGMSVEGIHNKSSQEFKDFEKLNQAARDQGKNTKFSAAQAGDALNYLALAGYNANKAVKALPTVLNLATAGGMELAEASDMITDSMSALEIDATQKNLTNFGDQMAKAAQKSNTSVKQLGAAILAVGGDAKGLNGATKDLKNAEMNTALGILADSGIKGAEGGTKLRNIIKSLTPMKKQAIAAFDELGVKAYDTATGKMRPLEDTFTDITKAMSGMTDEKKTKMLNTMFNATDKKAVSAMMAATATNAEQLGTSFAAAEIPVKKLGLNLNDMIKNFDNTQSQAKFTKKAMKEFGIDAEQAGVMYEGLLSATTKDGNNRWQDLKTKIINSDGAMQDMADTMNDNLKGRLTELGSATSEVGIAFTRNLMEPAKDTVEEIAGWMGDLGTSIDKRGFDGFVDGVGIFTQKIIHMLADSAPQGMDAVMQIMNSLVGSFEANEQRISKSGVKVLMSYVKGMSKIIPRVIVLGAKILSGLLTGIAENMPEMMKQGQNGIDELISGVMKEAPTIIQAGTEIIISLVQGLTDNLPTMIQAGMALIMMLVQSLVEMTPAIIQCAVVLINSLLLGIQQNLPQLVDSAIYIIFALAQGLIDLAPNLVVVAIDIIYQLGMGILQSLPQILVMAQQLIQAIIQGLVEGFPQILSLGIQLIVSLAQGIIQALPIIVDLACELIVGLVSGLITNLPMILEGGIQLVIALVTGIVGAIPFLLESIGKLIVAVVEGIFSADWASVGKNLLGSIKDGFVNGIKGLFGGGKEAAEETKSGVESVWSDFKLEMPIDNTDLFSNGHSGGQRYFDGMNAGMTGTELTAPNIDVSSYYQTGLQGGQKLNQGVEDELSKNKPKMSTSIGLEKLGIKSVDTTGITNSYNQVSNASNQMQSSVTSSVQTVNQATSDLSNNTGFSDLSKSAKKSMKSIVTSTTQGMNQMQSAVARGLNSVVNNFRSKMSTVRSIVASTNLYSSGQNVVTGLINGMNSKRQQLIDTAKAMGNAIKKATNTELDIHSPSRVMKQTGVNVVLGTKIGMEDTFGELRKTSQKMGTHVKEDTDKKATPQSRYRPSNTNTVHTNNSSSNFVYNPNINLTVNGSVDKQSEFKLRKMMKEILKEDKEQMKRLHPRLREV